MDHPSEQPRRHRPVEHRQTHSVEALAHAAINTDRQLAWLTPEPLTAALAQAAADGSTSPAITKITRADLIVVDDISTPPTGQTAAKALYRLVDAAHERRSVAVTSDGLSRVGRVLG